MATALDVITRAMRKLGVLAIGKDPKAAESVEGLSELNDMLAEWSIDGIDLAPLPLALTDVIDVPDDHVSTIILSLAARLGGIYGASLSPADVSFFERRMAVLRAYHWDMNDLGSDNPLARCNLANYD